MCELIISKLYGKKGAKFMSIYDVEFGTSDAETELIRSPQIFDKAFFDPHNYIDELVNGYKFIVSGRKGDGKSAYLAKLKRLADEEDSLETIGVSLERLNSKFFEKFTDQDLVGGKRYVPMWKCILLLELVKHFEIRGFQIQRPNYTSLVDALSKMGLLHGDSVEETITTLDSTDISINVRDWVSYGRHIEKEVVIRGANQIYSILSEELKSAYLGHKKFRMVLDGLDDILRNKDFSIEIITGLLRAANEINNFFYKKALNFKIIVLIRSDILDKCRDPDISKIKLASKINLSWKPGSSNYESDLAKLVLARFRMEGDTRSFLQIWHSYFPLQIDDKNSLAYMLDNTLYKPRDMLMFFSLAQRMIADSDEQISEYEFKLLLTQYSEEYFVGHMQDELTGFLPDEAINELQSVISKIGSRRFSYEAFSEEMSQHKEFENILPEDVLKLLFERGYIGQYRKRPDHPKEEFLFQTHINPSAKYEKEDDCVLHRGLIRAFGV